MPAILNWLLRLLPTNPICMRLVQGGSRRTRHLLIRSGYLGVMIVVLVFAMLSNTGRAAGSVRELAMAGAQTFTWISYLQVGLICLLTPVFMAGAIAQEANPRTWDIMLTTPLGNLQIVLGNLFGRLFFILALLFSTLPLFAVTQYFGGVPGGSIFASYAIAGGSSLLVAAIAITLCVNRTAGRRAVFWFYAVVVMYLFLTYAADLRLRVPTGVGSTARLTTVLTPLNPFLALEVLLKSNTYVPHDMAGARTSWITGLWMSRPITAFCWLCVGVSLVLIGYSTARVRMIGSRTGTVPWHRRLLRLGAKGAVERPARTVGHNPVAWRESVARGKTLTAIVARWGFVALGIGVGIGLVGLFHFGTWNIGQFQAAMASVLAAEIVVIALVAINTSATAVSKEREDGTLDLILTTPIQPGPYLAGKMRGLIQYLLPLLLVPTVTMLIVAIYVLAGGFGRPGGVWLTGVPLAGSTTRVSVPMVLWEGAVTLPVVLLLFTALCVTIGLYFSIRSKGTIGSVVAAVLVVSPIAAFLGLCGMGLGKGVEVIGAVITALNPINLVFAIIYPADTIPKSMADPAAGRVALAMGTLLAAAGYAAAVYGLHSTMKRTFMMTVRKLAGTA